MKGQSWSKKCVCVCGGKLSVDLCKVQKDIGGGGDDYEAECHQ